MDDVTKKGSSNPGATNVWRSNHKKVAVFVLLSDALKAFVPLVAFLHYGDDADLAWLLVAAAFLGHAFPVYYRFKGGKGVSVFLGLVFAVSWLSGLIAVAVWLLLVRLSGYSSIGGISMALSAPWVLYAYGVPSSLFYSFFVVSLLVLALHKKNLVLLYNTFNR